MKNEYIVAPAIRKDNKVRISRFSHAEMISCDGFFKGAEQGFITNLDRFVDRKEALKIAEKNNKGLIKFYKSDELYSEDLFKTEFELAKENEELKIVKSAIQTLQINLIEDEKYIVISKSSFLDGSYKHLIDEYIPIQKVKEKIEELDIEISMHEYADDDSEEYKQDIEKNKRELLIAKKVLQQLLENDG